MKRRRLVRVPASSANLGPGYDVLAAALSLQLELEVEETGEFFVHSDVSGVPTDRSNLCVKAFERLHPADGMTFQITAAPDALTGVRESVEAAGFTVENAELTMVPKTTVEIEDEGTAKKILRLIDALEENDDVQDVYSNFDIPERVLETVAG